MTALLDRPAAGPSAATPAGPRSAADDLRHRLAAATVADLCATPAFRGALVTGVVLLPQRSLCLRVRFADGRRVVVKRALPAAGGAPRGSVAHEATVVARLHPLGLPVPRPVSTAGTAVLVTEDAGPDTLADRRTAAGGTAADWAEAVGRALAAVHTGVTPARLPLSDPARRLLCTWTAVRSGLPSSTAVDRFARHLRLAGTTELLEEAVAQWAPACLVHGDVRAANVVCGPDPDLPRPLVLVDWEVAGHGDPRWDVGCLVGDLLTAWVDGLDVDAGDEFSDWSATAPVPFAAVAAEVRALTAAYAAVRPVTPGDRRQWLRYAAFPLVQRACASAGDGPDLSPRARACLLLAGRLLHRPDSCEELLCP
jgi:aminoglycoside phosphotransferase (APT) family kinase protein